MREQPHYTNLLTKDFFEKTILKRKCLILKYKKC